MHFSRFVVMLLMLLGFTLALLASAFTPGARIGSNPEIGVHAENPGACEANQGNCIEASSTIG